MKNQLAWLLILLTGILVFLPSFFTSIHGDEWKAIWLARQALYDHGNYMPIQVGDTPYVFEHATLDLMSRVFPLHSGLFYVVNFVIRCTAALYLYFFVKSLTKNTHSAYVSTFLFFISSIGVEAVIWTRNYSSYIGMIIFMHCYLFFVRKNLQPIKVIVSLALVLILNTTRSHGVLLALSMTLIAEFLIHTFNKKHILTIFALFIVYILASQTPFFGLQAGNLFHDFEVVQFLLNFTGNLGKVLVVVPNYMKASFLALVTLLFVWKKPSKQITVWSSLLLANIAMLLYSYTVLTENYRSSLFALSVLGTLFLFAIYEYFYKQNDELRNTILVVSLVVSWLIIPMIRQPLVVMGNDHRYLIYSAIVIPLISAFAINNSKLAIIPICFFAFVFSQQVNNLLTAHKVSHSTQYNNIVWSKITQQISPEIYKKTDTIILFSDENQASQINSSVYFGGMYHFGLLYNEFGPEENLKELYFVRSKAEAEKYIEGNYILLNFSTPTAKL